MTEGLASSRWAPENRRRPKRRWPRSRSRSRRRSAQSLPPPTLSAPNLSTPSREDNLASYGRSEEPLAQSHISFLRSPGEEFARFFKIVARLNWKLPSLKQGYRMAIDTVDKEPHQIQNCEIQFKLDFHEFYMLLERALVRLMAVFGIEATGDAIVMGGTVTPQQSQRGSNQHQYHANVLAALTDPRNPLCKIFEDPEVKKQLLRAKDLRNRWKNIDDADFGSFQPAPLSTYNLDHMVSIILSAIELAHDVAFEYVGRDISNPTKDTNEPSGGKDWEFIVDAMDWEAV